MNRALLRLPLAGLCLLFACSAPLRYDAVSSPTNKTLWPEEEEHAIAVHFGDELFTTLHYDAAPRPFLYPVQGPQEIPITRAFPQEKRAGESTDHPHHTSLWIAHGDVNGTDFWHPAAANGGVIEFTGRLKELLRRGKRMRLRHEYLWKDHGGQPLLRERRTTLLGGEEDQRWIDVKIELRALVEEVTFGDTKEGFFALRLHPALRLTGDLATGEARNSEGITGKEVWGKRANWVQYQGTVEGKAVGVVLFDAPTNPRHPTWWHAREYGLVAANPFGKHAFEGGTEEDGRYILHKDETLTFVYRVWIHSGHKSPEEVEQAFRVFQAQLDDM